MFCCESQNKISAKSKLFLLWTWCNFILSTFYTYWIDDRDKTFPGRNDDDYTTTARQQLLFGAQQLNRSLHVTIHRETYEKEKVHQKAPRNIHLFS